MGPVHCVVCARGFPCDLDSNNHTATFDLIFTFGFCFYPSVINVSAGTWWVILLILMALVVVVAVTGCILWRLKTQKKRMRSVDILAVDNTYYHTQIPSPSQTPLPPMPGASMHTATLPQGYYTSMDTGTGVPPPAQYFPPHYRAPSLADGMYGWLYRSGNNLKMRNNFYFQDAIGDQSHGTRRYRSHGTRRYWSYTGSWDYYS